MTFLQTIKRVFVRGPCFEVLKNKDGDWFMHERASNGQIKNVSEAYATKSNAERAAKRKAAETRYATWKTVK